MMAAEKIYRRYIPVSYYDIAGMETWLSKMAEKGLCLRDINPFYARFTKDTPKKVRYRLEPTGKDTTCPSLELYDLSLENGWRYVATLRKMFHVFMSEDADAPELHTDPVVQSDTLKKVSRQLRFSFWCFVGTTLLMLGSTVQLLLSREDWVRSLLLYFNTGIYVFVPVYIVLCVFLGISVGRIARIRRRLRAGRPFDHHVHYRRRVTLRTLELLMILVCIAVLVASLYITNTMGFKSIRSLSDAPGDIPFLSLETIDPVYADYSDGHFYRKYTLLVPEQYVVLQNLHPAAGSVRTVLQTEYYKALFPCLAETVYDEMLRSSFARFNVTTAEYEMQEYETLDTPLFDAAAYARIKNGPYDPDPDGFAQYIVARSDKTVIVVRYEGSEDLRDKLAAIADAFF